MSYDHGIRVQAIAGRRHSCRALLCGLLCFLGVQAALALLSNQPYLPLRDPEYSLRLQRLRRLLKHQPPSRPLLLTIGSSRTAIDFSPKDLPPWQGASRVPLIFNFGMIASGPVAERICLQRLLQDGIHPQSLLIEIHPGTLAGPWNESLRLRQDRLTWRELRQVHDYLQTPELSWGKWLWARVQASSTWRYAALSKYAPSWIPHQAWQDSAWTKIDAWGNLAMCPPVTPECYRSTVAINRRLYRATMECYQPQPDSERACRDLLQLCRRQLIAPVLVMMPESTDYQSWYPKVGLAQFHEHILALSQEFGVPLVDARSWMPDSAFYDSHHLSTAGAQAFTRKLAEHVLYPVCSTGSNARLDLFAATSPGARR